MVSFIIVSYNEIKYLERAIFSCINQNIEDYEIIIGDDGSNDGSIDKIKELQQNNPKIKFFVMNRDDSPIIPSIRVSNLLKKAFSISKGKYITCLSADDYFLDDSIKPKLEFLEKNDDYCSCYSNYEKRWSENDYVNIVIKSPKNQKLIWCSNYIHVSCFLFKKEVILNLLPNFCDDIGLVFSILCTGKSCYLDMNSFSYTQRDKSIMHKADKIELVILELMIYQDIIDSNLELSFYTYKALQHILYCFKNREKLTNEKYSKYFLLVNEKHILYKMKNCNNNIKYMKEIKSIIKKGKKEKIKYRFYKLLDILKI